MFYFEVVVHFKISRSVGCILYELAVGNPPFATHSLFQLIKKVRYEQIQWPQHLSPDCGSFLKGNCFDALLDLATYGPNI